MKLILMKIYLNYFRFFYPVEVKLVKDKATLHKIYELRYKVFCEQIGFIDKTLFIDKEEKDSFDENSEMLAAFRNGRIIGCIRVVFDKGIGLPTERYSNFKAYKKNDAKYVEFSRFIISKDDRNILTIFSLIKAAIKLSFSRKATDVIITTSENKETKYRLFGFRKIIGSYKYQGVNDKKLSVTMVTNLLSGKKIMNKINPFFDYFYNHDLVNIQLD